MSTTTDSERKCEHCSRPLEPVHMAEKVQIDTGVLYADNLWALDGVAVGLQPAWACRHTCGDPIPIDDTSEALKEWSVASDEAMRRLDGRPKRTQAPGA